MQRAVIAACEGHKDSPASTLLQDVLDRTERRIWFLFEMAQGLDNTR